MKRSTGAVLLLFLTMILLSCTDGVLAPKGRWNPGDTQYDPTTDPANTADKVPFDPMSLTATSVSDAAIDLAWRDTSEHETGFRVYRKIGSSGTYAAITPDLAADTASYRCTGLTPSTEYWFKVTAFNAVGESGPTNEAHAATMAATLSSSKAITAFGFSNPAATGTIDDGAKTIAVTVPTGTVVTALVAVFTHTGSGVTVGGVAQVSGTTSNDFTNPVQYVVTAQDATTATYTVTVTVTTTLSSSKALTVFSFSSPAATGVIDEGTKTIAVTVPNGTAVTALVAVFTHTGASVKVGGVAQASGTTANDFTSPVQYVVTAQDATTATYAVTVTVASVSSKAMTAFGFASPAATGVIDEGAKTITVMVPNGTAVTALVAVFTHTGASAKVGGVTQVSGTTANDFTIPVPYTVTAQDATTATYTVTVTVAAAAVVKLYHLDGNAWVSDPDPPADTVSVTGCSSTLYALTAGGSVYRYDGGWQLEAVSAPVGAVCLAGSFGQLYALTNAGQIFLLDGGWRALAVAAPASSTAVAGVEGVLYVLTSGPALYLLDGNAWVSMTVPAGAVSITGFGWHPYCLTSTGTIYLFDGGWVQQSVAAPSGSTDIAGHAGALYALVLQ